MGDKDLIKVLRALADPTRFRMVQRVANAGELSCGQIVDRFDLSQPTISHHVKILTQAKVFWVRRDRQQSLVSVNRRLIGVVAALLPARLTRVPARGAAARPRP